MSLLIFTCGEINDHFSTPCYKGQEDLYSSNGSEVEDEGYVGYGVESSDSYDKKYRCGRCNRLLWEPVQNIPCGHRFCLQCYKMLIRKGNTECLDCQKEKDTEPSVTIQALNKCFRDNAIRKEILNLHVTCPLGGCTWSGVLRDLKDHRKSCGWEMMECPYKTIGCEGKFLRKDKDEHDRDYTTSHQQCLLSAVLLGQQILNTPAIQQLTDCKLDTLSYPKPLEERVRLLESKMECEQTSTTTEVEILGKRTTQLEGKQQVFQNVLTVLTRELAKMEKLADSDRQLTEANSRIQFLEDQVRQQELHLAYKDRMLSTLASRLHMMEQASFDGTFVWKISNHKEKMEAALLGRSPCLYSPPFYTGQYGYKLCLKLFLNGDGAGLGTHLSVFLVIMKGEYDFMLKWPFPYKVTFTLLDQLGQRDVSASFKPTDSSSFQRPVQEKNIASGLPEFITLNELHSNDCAYIKDNVLYIKAEISPVV